MIEDNRIKFFAGPGGPYHGNHYITIEDGCVIFHRGQLSDDNIYAHLCASGGPVILDDYLLNSSIGYGFKWDSSGYLNIDASIGNFMGNLPVGKEPGDIRFTLNPGNPLFIRDFDDTIIVEYNWLKEGTSEIISGISIRHADVPIEPGMYNTVTIDSQGHVIDASTIESIRYVKYFQQDEVPDAHGEDVEIGDIWIKRPNVEEYRLVEVEGGLRYWVETTSPALVSDGTPHSGVPDCYHWNISQDSSITNIFLALGNFIYSASVGGIETHNIFFNNDGYLEASIGEGSSYILPLASSIRGGIKANEIDETYTVEVKIDPSTEKLYVPTYSGGGGVGTFDELSDTPSDKTGKAKHGVIVDENEENLEYIPTLGIPKLDIDEIWIGTDDIDSSTGIFELGITKSILFEDNDGSIHNISIEKGIIKQWNIS